MNTFYRASRILGVGLSVLITIAAFAPSAFAQKGGKKGNSPAYPSASRSSQTRMDALTSSFTLTKDQQKSVRTILDDAYRNAEPVRDSLTKTRAALAAAVQANKGDAGIADASTSYAVQATAMAGLEMKALADVMKTLDKDQATNNAAISSAFFMMRGAFVDKKWDDVPNGRSY